MREAEEVGYSRTVMLAMERVCVGIRAGDRVRHHCSGHEHEHEGDGGAEQRAPGQVASRNRILPEKAANAPLEQPRTMESDERTRETGTGGGLGEGDDRRGEDQRVPDGRRVVGEDLRFVRDVFREAAESGNPEERAGEEAEEGKP